MTIRVAACDNEIEQRDGSYATCPGRLTFYPGDRAAACNTCYASCGVLVARYLDGEGPTLEAELAFEREVAELWRYDHADGHPRGRGNCPICRAA